MFNRKNIKAPLKLYPAKATFSFDMEKMGNKHKIKDQLANPAIELLQKNKQKNVAKYNVITFLNLYLLLSNVIVFNYCCENQLFNLKYIFKEIAYPISHINQVSIELKLETTRQVCPSFTMQRARISS